MRRWGTAALAATTLLASAASADARLSLHRAHRAAVDAEHVYWGSLYSGYVTDDGCSRLNAATASCHFSLEGEATDAAVGAKFLIEIDVHQDAHRLAVWERFAP